MEAAEGEAQMKDELPEYFPELDELREQQRMRADALFVRMQTVIRMGQEFCRKMASLGDEPSEYLSMTDKPELGYVIPFAYTDEGGGAAEARVFVGENYVADYEDDRVGIPLNPLLHARENAADIVEAYKRAMLDVLLGNVYVIRP